MRPQGSGETFRILQIGDSHTAGDFLPTACANACKNLRATAA